MYSDLNIPCKIIVYCLQIRLTPTCTRYLIEITHSNLVLACTHTDIFRNFTPFSFVASISCSNFKVILNQWLQARLSCKESTCSGFIHSYCTIVFLGTAPALRLNSIIASGHLKWSEANVVFGYITSTFDIIRFAPVQS